MALLELNNLTIKTHDGTSSGPLKDALHKMVSQYSQDAYSHIMVISSDGKMIDEHHDLLGPSTATEDSYIKKEGTDMHVIANEGYGDENYRSHYDTALLNEHEMKELMKQNEDGEYLIRSQTLVGADGKSMTVIRDNSFNEENHETYTKLCEEFTSRVNEWGKKNRGEPYSAEVERLEQEFIQTHGRQPTFDETWGEGGIREQATSVYDNVPTVTDFIMEELAPEFEKCGVKIKFQKNDHIPYTGQDYDSSYESWREELYELKDEDRWEQLWYEQFGDDYDY